MNQILPNVDQIKGNSLFSAGKYGIANQGRLNVLSVSYNTTQGHYCDYNYYFLCNYNQRGTAAHTSVFCSGNEGRLFKEISNYRFKAQFKIMIVCHLYYKMYTRRKKKKKKEQDQNKRRLDNEPKQGAGVDYKSNVCLYIFHMNQRSSFF